MSHRRKSARPTNKHWRNGPYTYDQLPDVDDVEEEEEGGGGREEEEEAGDAGGDQAIEIPPDIFQDFEQLKHATNLDTSTLMRNLLKDYHRVSPQSPWHRPVSEESGFKSSTPPSADDKQVMSETFGTRLFDVGIVRRSPAIDTGYVSRDSPVAPEVESGDQPLDLSVVVKSERGTGSESLQNERTEVTFQTKSLLQRSLASADSPRASPGVLLSSAMIPSALMTTDATGSHLSQGGLVMASTMPNQCKVVMSSAVPSSGSFTVSGDKNECIMMPMQMSMQLPTVTQVEGGQKFLTGNFSVETNGTQQGNIVAIPILQAVSGPMTSVPMQVTSVPVQSQNASPSMSQPQPQLQMQQQQQQQPAPVQTHVPARRGRKPGSLNKGNKVPKPAKSNEMKIVAENTMFPGVYTSILKLPWSRRSRTKAQPPAPPPPPPQPSMTIIPVPTPELSDAAAAPATTTSQPATTQSVMMVYPNATISALGKPVRKRGRPPKLPVLSHLLAEKKPKRDNVQTTVATSLSSQSATISADGSMLSILSTHSIGADALPDDEKLKKLQLLNPEQQVPSYQPSIPEPQRIEPNGSTKESNGSMFQEMLLSSKSLINIKPRKRQSSNIIKSGENFICTSFRIRPRASRHKPKPTPVLTDTQLPAQATPVQVVSNASNITNTGDIHSSSPVTPVESLADTSNLSPTSTVVDSPLSKNMFHELYHCKVCNDIVPAEDKQTHKQQHVPVKFFCLTCGQEYYSFLQGKDGDDPEAPRSFQCERCSENYNESSESVTSDVDLKSSENRCEDCDEEFKSLSEFRDHRREVHGEEETELKSFSCDECDKLFLSERSYLNHKEKHKTSLRCVLDDCPVLSADEAELESHVKECHNKKEYPCVYDDCKKKFMKKFHLQEHIRVKHFNIRDYRCSWPGCYKEFAAERHLKVHLLIHKDEKPLKCDFCDYRCRQRNAMNWHMRKHPEAPYRYRKFGMLGGGDD